MESLPSMESIESAETVSGVTGESEAGGMQEGMPLQEAMPYDPAGAAEDLARRTTEETGSRVTYTCTPNARPTRWRSR